MSAFWVLESQLEASALRSVDILGLSGEAGHGTNRSFQLLANQAEPGALRDHKLFHPKWRHLLCSWQLQESVLISPLANACSPATGSWGRGAYVQSLPELKTKFKANLDDAGSPASKLKEKRRLKIQVNGNRFTSPWVQSPASPKRCSINKTLCFLSFTLTLLTPSSMNNNRSEVNPSRRTITLVMMQRLCRCLWKHIAQISESDCLHGVCQNSENNIVHSRSVNCIFFPPTLMPRDDVLAAIFVGGVHFLLLPFEASGIKPRVSYYWAVHSSPGVSL